MFDPRPRVALRELDAGNWMPGDASNTNRTQARHAIDEWRRGNDGELRKHGITIEGFEEGLLISSYGHAVAVLQHRGAEFLFTKAGYGEPTFRSGLAEEMMEHVIGVIAARIT